MSSTAEKVREILAAQLDIDKEKIKSDSLISDDLGADSLDVVELMMSFEEEFGITISEEDVGNFKTVGDIAKFIEAQV